MDLQRKLVAELVAYSRARYRAGDLKGAQQAIERALQLETRDALLWTNHAVLLQELCRSAEAQRSIERALALAPDDPSAVIVAATVAGGLGDEARAEALLRGLLARQPDHVHARIKLAGLLERCVRFDEAEREARACLEVAPEDPLLNLVLAQCAFHRRELDACEAYLGRMKGGRALLPQHAAYLAADVADARGQHDAAFAAYEAANAIAAANDQRIGVGPEAALAQLETARTTFTADWVAGWAPLPTAPPLPFRPAFLVGFPRSGTTLLEQILDAHPGVAAIEEKPYLDEAIGLPGVDAPAGLSGLTAELHADVRARYAALVLEHRPDANGKVLLDKFPLRLALAGTIQRLIPEARFIFALRHPYDVVLSCFMREFGANPAMANFHKLADAARYYDGMMALWHKHRELQPLAVVTVRYEALVEDLESQVRPALAHLGLEWDASVEGFAAHARSRGRINTPSYAQVSRDLYTSARARFMRYLPHFDAEARALLDPWVERHGYPPVAGSAPP